VAALLELSLQLGFRGANFGNTSTSYDRLIAGLAPKEQQIATSFVAQCQGGISGTPLRTRSLELIRTAKSWLAAKRVNAEHFALIQTGGIQTEFDVRESLAAGADLCQWYTGIFRP
jgi:dihydroorotate dehydrogenase